MESEIVFKTKTGYCHILPDKIVLTRDGVIGNMAKVAVGNNIARILFIYSGISIALMYLAYDNYLKGEILTPIIFGLIALYLVIAILSSLNNSSTPLIERDKIQEIKLKKAFFGITRSRFVVRFEDETGKIKNRLIMLPGSFSGGRNETEKAIKIMVKEKLLSK